MNKNSIDNVAITVEHALTEPQQCPNSAQIQSHSEKFIDAVKKMKITSMNPTPLYIFFSCFYDH